jgi:hypothetical protein
MCRYQVEVSIAYIASPKIGFFSAADALLS